MIKGLLDRVKVAKSIKAIHYTKRIIPKLTVGENYFVCFANNNTYPCVLKKIITEYGHLEVEIEIPMKPMSKRGFIDINGKLSHHWVSTHILRADEIGRTREEAAINSMTF